MASNRRTLIFGAAGGSLFSLFPFAAAWAAQKFAVRLWPEDDSMRVSVETSSKIKYTYTVLRHNKPYRLILDLQGVAYTSAVAKKVAALKPDGKMISSVRGGQFKKGVTRLVFTLKEDIKVESYQLGPVANYGPRIMVNLLPTNADLMKRVIDRTSKKVDQANQQQAAKSNQKQPEQKAPAKQEAKNSARAAETLVVVVDPGHGGEDPGAIGKAQKTYEKHVALSIGRELVRRLNATSGVQAYLTRNSDVFIPLATRAQIGVQKKAHIFVSVHADAWLKPSARGSSVFTLSTHGASSLQARWLAQTQNRSDEIGGMMFKDVAKQARSTVVDLLAETKLRYGMQLGGEVISQLRKIGSLHKATVESANFAVLKAQGIPSILVESGFLSNPNDEKLLRTQAYQQKVAQAIYFGIINAVKDDPSLLRLG